MRTSLCRISLGIAILLCVLPILHEHSATAQFNTKKHAFVCPAANCDTTCETAFYAGDQPNDLQVHVVGRALDTLEIYFQNEVYRETLPGTVLSNRCFAVFLAQKNPLGTFAVRFGQHSDRVIAFAYNTDVKTKPVSTKELRPFPDEPVTLRWMTDRILKLTPANDIDRSMIIRFSDSPKKWERFDPATNKWDSL